VRPAFTASKAPVAKAPVDDNVALKKSGTDDDWTSF
jgi:hypothetical protein